MSEVRTLTLLTRGDLLADERTGERDGATARGLERIGEQMREAATWREWLCGWLCPGGPRLALMQEAEGCLAVRLAATDADAPAATPVVVTDAAMAMRHELDRRRLQALEEKSLF